MTSRGRWRARRACSSATPAAPRCGRCASSRRRSAKGSSSLYFRTRAIGTCRPASTARAASEDPRPGPRGHPGPRRRGLPARDLRDHDRPARRSHRERGQAGAQHHRREGARPLRDRSARPHSDPARGGRRRSPHRRLLPQPPRPPRAGFALRHRARLGRLRVPHRRGARRQAGRRERVHGRQGRRSVPSRAHGGCLTGGATSPPQVKWLNRNVVGIGLADLAADANYEMVFAVLPLFITAGLGAPALAVGLIEGVGDGSSAVVKLWSGWYSDRIGWRKQLAVGGYGGTVFGLGLLVAITAWPQVIIARALAWMGRGLRQPIRSAMLAGSVDKADLGKTFGFHEALDTAGALIGPAVAFLLLSTGHGFRTIFAAASMPGILCVILFAVLTRDPRHGKPDPVPFRVPLPAGFLRFMVPTAIVGLGTFAPAFFTLRAAQIMQPELGRTAALAAAVGFYLAHNAVGSVVSFPAGWLRGPGGARPGPGARGGQAGRRWRPRSASTSRTTPSDRRCRARPVGSRTGSAKHRFWRPPTSPLRPHASWACSAMAGLPLDSWPSWSERKIQSSARSRAR